MLYVSDSPQGCLLITDVALTSTDLGTSFLRSYSQSSNCNSHGLFLVIIKLNCQAFFFCQCLFLSVPKNTFHKRKKLKIYMHTYISLLKLNHSFLH